MLLIRVLCTFCGFVVILVTMAPSKKKMVPGKGKRQKISLEVKDYALDKYDEGIRNQDIIVMIKKRFGIEVTSSTVSTWKKDREKIRSMGVDKFTCKEIRVNPSQRSRILIDMEYFLVMYILRHQDNSIPLTKQCITTQAGMLYTKLANTGIYISKGCRINTLKELRTHSVL